VSERTERGKIKSVRLGAGGYQDAKYGFTLDLGSGCWSVTDFWGTWADHSEGCEWSIADQQQKFLASFMRVKELMRDAGVDDFSKLKNVPVEITFEGNTMKSWRIMTEVL
jgi:hypothetical protein